MYRILFVIGGFYLIGIIIYLVMAASTPMATDEELESLKEARGSAGLLPSRLDNLEYLESQLTRIEAMRTHGLITEEEAEKLRAKALGI